MRRRTGRASGHSTPQSPARNGRSLTCPLLPLQRAQTRPRLRPHSRGHIRAPPDEPGSRWPRRARPRSRQTGPRPSASPCYSASSGLWWPERSRPFCLSSSLFVAARLPPIRLRLPRSIDAASAPASTSPSSSISAREQAAEGLSGLLAQSVQDRSPSWWRSAMSVNAGRT